MRNISSYLDKKLKNQYQTPYENAQPSLEISVARAKSSIQDSSYFTVETIREKQGLGDIGVGTRRQKSHGIPDGLFDIHVQDGVVGTALRSYPDKLKEGWKDQFSLGSGTSVAITFNGEWEKYRNGWGFSTEEYPWLYWVDSNKNLYTQKWADGDTKQLLAENVLKVKSIRGWKTLEAENKDQGIVIAYIKTDGKVYYRQYIQLLDLSYVFTPEIKLTQFTGTAVNVNLFLSNDYRLGFVIEDSNSKVYWCITSRNYSAMTTDTDTLTPQISLKKLVFEVTEIKEYKYKAQTETLKSNAGNSITGIALQDVREGYTDIILAQAEIINQKQFVLRFNYPIKMWLDHKSNEIVKEMEIQKSEIVGDTITFTIPGEFGYGDRDVLVTPNIILGLNPGSQYFFPGGLVKVKGLKIPLKVVVETFKIDIEKSNLRFDMTEVITYNFKAQNEIIRTLLDKELLNFKITEVSTEPI